MADLLSTIEPPVARPGGVQPLDQVDDRAEDRFDWLREDCIILKEQLSTAVYRNRANAIVIRQEGNGFQDDQFVILRDPEAVRLLITALREELGGGK